MKKAKFMLAAVAVFGVIGASLAFKANPGTSLFIATSINPGAKTTTCSLAPTSTFTTLLTAPVVYYTIDAAQPLTTSCLSTFTTHATTIAD